MNRFELKNTISGLTAIGQLSDCAVRALNEVMRLEDELSDLKHLHDNMCLVLGISEDVKLANGVIDACQVIVDGLNGGDE